ncbi:hypothetical protein OG689_34965 [Kitasatospora sp. NBC_00240]|uniref:hypothetical protein n=1 Tax=Kitasatospora sp. NBC_00240 TaxID=2903567 RepID=UPI00225394ED|nr:hypothetical protein [Kitasatospora sp. NBC_00240]MCX5214404.1 hypothetical protein [Kitasatospora sp. NBC_00240]
MNPRHDEAPAPRTAGPPAGLDRSLTARGFTTRRLRLRAAAVVLLLATAGTGAVLQQRTNVLGPGTVCGGAVGADAVQAALGPGRVSQTRFDEKAATVYNAPAWCSVTVGQGLFGGTRSATLRVLLDPTHPAAEAAPDARLFATAGTAPTPGGGGGGVTASTGWALLPAGCTPGLRVHVEVTGDKPSGDRANGLARLATEAAGGVAAKNGCSNGPTPTPGALSAQGVPRPVDFGAVCGLPALAPARSTATDGTYREQATTAFGPLWACEIRDGTTKDRVAAFTLTTEPQLLGRADDQPEPHEGTGAFGRAHPAEGSDDAMTATCHGKPVRFQLEQRKLPTAQGLLFPDRDGLWRQFLTAGGTAIGCEPILP